MTKDHYLEQYEFELNLLRRVLQPYLTDITDIKHGYKILCSITRIAKNSSQKIDPKLNEYYKQIVKIIHHLYSGIEHKINDLYEQNTSNNFPSHHIKPHIFQDYPYIPFESLFDKRIESWSEIDNNLDKYSDKISSAYTKITDNTKVAQTDNSKFFKEIELYLSEHVKPLKCNQLTLDLKKEVLKYKDQSISINTTTKEIKFLQLLLINRGRTVSHKEIAEQLELSFYEPGTDNKTAGEETRFLKRNLRYLLKKINMSNKDINQMIETRRSIGYRLKCN